MKVYAILLRAISHQIPNLLSCRMTLKFILFNSLAPGRFEWYFREIDFKPMSMMDGWGISREIALRWMLLDLTDGKSALVQVMAWCRQATSHYLSNVDLDLLSPYGVTRPQWVKKSTDFSLHIITIIKEKWKVLYFCCVISSSSALKYFPLSSLNEILFYYQL